jgi:hypothetical protein
MWVIFVGGNRGGGQVYVRSTSNRVGILCTAAKDGQCHTGREQSQQKNKLSLFESPRPGLCAL